MEIKNNLDAHNKIRSFLASSRDILPPLPEILVRMQSAINDSKIDAKDLSKIILRDPSLTAKIMKLANSAYYRHGKLDVNNVTDAIVIMGFDAIRNVVLGLSVYNIMNKLPRVDGYKSIWRHSLCCGVCAQKLAELVGIKVPESIFVAGLLHDIGKLILAQVFPEYYGRVIDVICERDISLSKVENSILHTNHSQSGELVAEFWNFPKYITHAIRYHEIDITKENIKRFDSKETNIVVLANLITHFVYGAEPGFQEISNARILELGDILVGCDGDKLYELINKLKNDAVNIGGILEMDIQEKSLKKSSYGNKKSESNSNDSQGANSYPLISKSLVEDIKFKSVMSSHIESLKEKLKKSINGGIAIAVDSSPIADSIAEIKFRYDRDDVLMHAVGLVKWVERIPKKIVGIQFIHIEKIKSKSSKLNLKDGFIVSSPAATTIEMTDDAVVVRGEFAVSSQAGFMHCWTKLLQSDKKNVVIDLRQIIRISSMAIGLLVGSQMDANGVNKNLLIKIPERFRKILAIAGVDKILNLKFTNTSNTKNLEISSPPPKIDKLLLIDSASDMIDTSKIAEEKFYQELEKIKAKKQS